MYFFFFKKKKDYNSKEKNKNKNTTKIKIPRCKNNVPAEPNSLGRREKNASKSYPSLVAYASTILEEL